MCAYRVCVRDKVGVMKLVRSGTFYFFFFFFQAEDGIRDYKVTGVQTCALPIYLPPRLRGRPPPARAQPLIRRRRRAPARVFREGVRGGRVPPRLRARASLSEIGRASCRERV